MAPRPLMTGRSVAVRGASVALAALLGLAFDAACQSAPALRQVKLKEATVIEGIPCAATRRTVGIYQSGRLESCALDEPATVGRYALEPGTWVFLGPAGELRSVWLARDARIDGHLCRGTGYGGWSVTFHPSGALKLCYLAEPAVLLGVPCRKGTFWGEIRGGTAVWFHENGGLASCSVSESLSLGDRTYRARERVRLSSDGSPLHAH
jgi:hypothetical protein